MRKALIQVRFSAGHRLLRHAGSHAFFHGHNYVADFYAAVPINPNADRVLSLAEMALRSWIEQHWDHGFLLNRDDQNGLQALKLVEPTKYFALPYNPTAANMAHFLLREVCPDVLSHNETMITRVVIWETDQLYGEASVQDKMTANSGQYQLEAV